MIKLPVIYSQLDPRWSGELLGFNTDPKYTFKNYACLICSISSVAEYYGHHMSPLVMNEELKDIDGFVNGGLYVWGSFTTLFKDIKEIVSPEIPTKLSDFHINTIKKAIDNGNPVMVWIDVVPETDNALDGMHWVIIVDYDKNDEDNFTIADPLGGTLHSLKTYLKARKTTARLMIQQYIIYEGKVPVEAQNDPKTIYYKRFLDDKLILKSDTPETAQNKIMAAIHNRDEEIVKKGLEVENIEAELVDVQNKLGEAYKTIDDLNIQLHSKPTPSTPPTPQELTLTETIINLIRKYAKR